ncbi:MAG TPA: BrnT family toxin [Thermoanaerobaculia bacterium]|nr:BrnT family toxin [Thermoanaerobaculia bacterium]
MKIEWDDAKDRANQRKHGIGFQESSELFESGVAYLEIFDDEHSVTEDRFIALGPLRRGMVLVIWTQRDDDTIRIVSARRATKREHAMYLAYVENSK